MRTITAQCVYENGKRLFGSSGKFAGNRRRYFCVTSLRANVTRLRCLKRGSHPSPPKRKPAWWRAFFYGWRTRITRAVRSPCGPPSLKYKEVQMSRSTGMYVSDPLRRSSSPCSLVEPEVLIPVRLKENPPDGGLSFMAGGLGLLAHALALRAAVAALRRSSSPCSLVEPEVLIPVRQ